MHLFNFFLILHRWLNIVFCSPFHCFLFSSATCVYLHDSFEGWIYGCSRQFGSLETCDARRERNKKWNYFSDHIFVHPSIAGQIHNSITSTIFLVKLSCLSWKICCRTSSRKCPQVPFDLTNLSGFRKRPWRKAKREKRFFRHENSNFHLHPLLSPLFMSQ